MPSSCLVPHAKRGGCGVTFSVLGSGTVSSLHGLELSRSSFDSSGSWHSSHRGGSGLTLDPPRPKLQEHV